MKSIVSMFVIGLFFTMLAHADANVDQAVKAAENWLKLVDGGQYDKGWEESATFFRANVKKEDFGTMVKPLRDSFGTVKSRKLGKATYSKSLPGAPDGEYVVIQYDTVFEKKAQAVETITPMKDSDGKWRVSGYYIK